MYRDGKSGTVIVLLSFNHLTNSPHSSLSPLKKPPGQLLFPFLSVFNFSSISELCFCFELFLVVGVFFWGVVVFLGGVLFGWF